MISPRTVIGLFLVSQSMVAAANQSIESISALTTEQEVSSAIDDGPPMTEETVLVDHDTGSFAPGNEAAVADGDEGEAQSSKNTLPAVGYVPKDARQDGQFNLVAETANEADQLYQKSALSENKKH